MVVDLLLDVEILVLPTVRDEDGVALSSRNAYLEHDERLAARAIPLAIRAAEKVVGDGEWEAGAVVAAARAVLESEPKLAVDYVALVDPVTLQPIGEITGEALLLLAVRVGRTRLIDNTTLRRA